MRLEHSAVRRRVKSTRMPSSYVRRRNPLRLALSSPLNECHDRTNPGRADRRQQEQQRGFSRYQSLLIALLAFVQFTIILDFMIMSPLGAIIMPALNITAAQFGVAVSAYAFSAGISGILAAGFADRFDRKRLLLFFYLGFTARNRAVRAGAELSRAAARPDRDRIVRRRDRLDRSRHHHRPFCVAAARPRDGLRADRVRGKPGAGHSGRAFSLQPLELARRFRRACRPVDRRDRRDRVGDAAGERASCCSSRTTTPSGT